MPLPPVECLSDSDGEGPEHGSGGRADPDPVVLARASAAVPHQVSTKISRLLQMRCKCSQECKRKRESCFGKFRARVEEVGQLRKHLLSLHKLDSDREACILQNVLLIVSCRCGACCMTTGCVRKPCRVAGMPCDS